MMFHNINPGQLASHPFTKAAFPPLSNRTSLIKKKGIQAKKTRNGSPWGYQAKASNSPPRRLSDGIMNLFIYDLRFAICDLRGLLLTAPQAPPHGTTLRFACVGLLGFCPFGTAQGKSKVLILNS